MKRLVLLGAIVAVMLAMFIPTTANADEFFWGGHRCSWVMDGAGHYSPTYNQWYVYTGTYWDGWRRFETTSPWGPAWVNC
jgi:hypothetical protein